MVPVLPIFTSEAYAPLRPIEVIFLGKMSANSGTIDWDFDHCTVSSVGFRRYSTLSESVAVPSSCKWKGEDGRKKSGRGTCHGLSEAWSALQGLL